MPSGKKPFPSAKWIGAGFLHANWESPSRPAPFFRKRFTWKNNGKKAELFCCGLGYGEFYLNGKKISPDVLNPAVTQYDRRARYIRYDITDMLEEGENTMGVILGNGWYDCSTAEVWHFDKVSWADYPKFLLELVSGGKTLLASGPGWKCLREEGPIRFNELRNGEFYDAGREIPGWALNEFDDSAWSDAVIVPGPGGVLTEQIMPPCRVMKELEVREVRRSYRGTPVYDFGQNLAGWVRIRVRGKAGSTVKLRYTEDFDNTDRIRVYVRSGEFQTDSYTLRGSGIEEWQPRFTYHGFRYVSAEIGDGAEILDMTACVVHTAFSRISEWKSSSPLLDRIMECNLWGYVGNFVGIPTDCPHREKNGWTGDTLSASDTGLFYFDTASSYHDWIQTMGDTQRPNGQLPGIVPTSGWGFNWGSGPVWDSAFIQIPWNVYVYRGDRSLIEENYEGMKRYLDYLETLATDHIVSFGLGDWCPPEGTRVPETALTSTAYYFMDAVILMKCALLLGHADDAAYFAKLSAAIRTAFLRRFGHKDGSFGGGEATSLGLALCSGLCPDSLRSRTAALLHETVLRRECRADFGSIGAKYVPRALAENGYGETAYRIFTQPAYPGWADWVFHGATTFWETWSPGGSDSQNHIMFGDLAAWMMQYPAGIRPDEAHPGFSHLTVQPIVPEPLDSLSVSCLLPKGKVSVRWEKRNGKKDFVLTVTAPDGLPCRVILPDGSENRFAGGEKTFTCRLPSRASR